MRQDPFADVKLIVMLIGALIVVTLGYRFLMTPQVDGTCILTQIVDRDPHHCSRIYRLFGI